MNIKNYVYMEKQYIPFGEEWKQEMKKWTKDLLIEALKKALIKNLELEEKLKVIVNK